MDSLLYKTLIATVFQISFCQWQSYNSYLSSNQKFTVETSSTAYQKSGYFVLPSSTTSSYITANFITCTSPASSYITLNKTKPSAQYYSQQSLSGSNYFISFDLYFQGTWSTDKITFSQGTFSYDYTYTSPTTYTLSQNFCDNLTYEIRTVNFTIPSTVSASGNPNFTISGAQTNQVSIKFFLVSKLYCYPSCSQCTGPNQNQCTSCYYGSVTAGVCPPCPANLPYYMKSNGCKAVCQQYSAKYAYGFCQSFNTQNFVSTSFSSMSSQPENSKWSILYDADHIDTTPTVIYAMSYVFGVMKYKAGVYRFVTEFSQSYYAAPVLIQIDAFFFNTMPIGCGLQFKINNTYYGSMYMSDTGLQFHRVQLYDTYNYGSCLTYTQCFAQELYLYVDIPQYQFLLSVVGNYTVSSAGWGIRYLAITSGYCPAYCQLCEVHFQCKICSPGYFQYRDGTCINSCTNQYQQFNGTYCQDYDDETPYSKYLIKEYQGNEGDPSQYSKYVLVSQNGTNFLKGSDIYYSFWQGQRVFGGPFVWAQAKFSRVFSIPDPHHQVTIGFYIIFGPNFPVDGSFIYTIETNTPVIKLQTNYKQSFADGKVVQVYEKILHSTSSLQMQWECFGPNNEPLNSFCGVYYLYIAVHNCQPHCSSCTDQNNCLTWSNTYDPTIIKFSQADCLSSQYLDKETYTCKTCASQCLTCLSKAVCTSCQPTFQLTKLGCSCSYSQYESNNQCNNCPIECNQCLSSTYCIECLNINNRKLVNGQCLCFDGYYAIIDNPVCQLCNKFCLTCTGPTQNDCLICKSIINIEQVGSICQCPSGYYYEEIQNSCLSCHYSCLTCFSTAINNCLTCNSLANRILKGLQCKCKPGYYEVSQICTACPITEDTTLIDCYKNCVSLTQIWHTLTCSSCDSGYQLIEGECQPICGDLVIKGYEQCEDGNNLLNDKCYNCQYQCPVQCLTCDVNTVFPCPDICGDGYITGLEECEDGNDIPYDGCSQCKYQCQQSCTKCIQGKCQECATKGWSLDLTVTPWICKEKCGDGILVGTEQCEENNTNDFDGCKDCKYYCRLGCNQCNYSNQTCLSCLNPGFTPQSYYCRNICGDGLKVTDPAGYYSEQCDDGNLIGLDGCSSSCYYECQIIDICTSCISNICQACATGFVLNSTYNRCEPICRDGTLVLTESCEDLLTLPYKCQNCKPKCQNSCIQCSTIGLGCLNCAAGFQLIDNLCYSICGDKIITTEEDCDDGNLIAEDGCHFCKYNCQTSCSDCYKGICLNCLDGYQLINNRCYPICNDGILAQQETCEFYNLLGYCNQCQLKCSLNCQICIFGVCTSCKPGYELDFALGNFYCVQILTEVSQSIDFCYTTLNNKCIKCQPNAYYDVYHDQCVLNTNVIDKCQAFGDFYCSECFENCIQCINNHCSLCDIGYQLNEEYQCKSFCGDAILTPDEQCEINDLNCQNCEFETPKNCINYLFDQCFTCEYGFYYNEVKKGCTSQCGDGIIVGEEQCEDPNQLPYDGCYECMYSCAENCQNCQYGICQKCQGQFYLFNNRCYEIGQLQLNCSLQCKLCYQDICLECNDQYILNEYNNCEKGCSTQCINCVSKVCFECSLGYYLLNNECQQIFECQEGYYFDDNTFQCQAYCGDGILSKQEQCDDKNISFDDDCYMCEYKCNEFCIECIHGECYQCLKDYQLIDYKCYSKCQSTCIKCVDGLCQQCQSQYYLDEYNFCQVIDCNYTFSCLDECGNGLKEKEEQCDDQNLEGIDECTNLCELSCEDNCEICVNGKCMICKTGYLISNYGCISNCGDSLVVGNEQCDDGNNIQFDGCFECLYQCCKYCLVCTRGICQQCETQFELDQENNICNFIERNEDNQMIENCKTISNKDCIECEKGQLDHISNICLIDNVNECSSNCITCRNSQCFECKEGYHGFQCRSYCGDGIITQLEECDDAIEYFDIDCFNCKINCPSNCQICALGVCSECRNGYYLDIISNSCSSICGDLILATDEVCDDGNDMRYDGCFQCQFQCQMECLDCQFGKCTLCVEPYILVISKGICEEQIFCGGLVGLYYNLESNDCLPQCGDGIVAGNEQCEDNNSSQYDGCYECKYQCSLNCSNCQKGICLECQRGYKLDGQNCQIICGDGIQLKEEECDDGNDTPRDGCTNCKIDDNFQCLIKQELSFCFQCQQNCIECVEDNNKIICNQCTKGYFLIDNTCIKCSEKCEECENTPNNCKVCSTQDCKVCEKNSGLYLDETTKKCTSKCGDGIKAINEACDDGNQIDQDGCNQNCEVEKQFECDSSGCHIPPKKSIEVDYKNSTTTNQFDLFYEDIQFDVCNKLKIWIDRFDAIEFNYTIDKKNQSNEGKKNCQVGFNFFKTIEESNLIHILVPLVENASRLMVEDEREIIIVPRKVVFYNEQQQAQAQSVAAASSTFTFLLQLIGPLTIILGGFNFFWTILDILTWINNFYFLNVDYPLNVKIFFNQLQWGDVISLPDIFSLNNPEDEYYFEAPVKFTEKEVNPLFMNNIQLFCGLILLTLLAYVLAMLYIKIYVLCFKKEQKVHKIEIFSINDMTKSIEIDHSMQQTSQKVNLKENVPKVFEYVYKESFKFVTNFRAILISVINLVFLDICLACILQLQFTSTSQYTIVQFNILLSILGLFFIAGVFKLYSFVCSQHPILYETELFSNNYSTLYEGINIKSSMALNYCFLNIIRKALFIFCTVYFYEIPLLQTTTCCLSCFLNLALVAYQNPFETRSILIQTAFPDLCIFFIIFMTILLAVHDVANIFSFDQKYFLGWIILFFIGLSIFVQLIFLFQEFFSNVRDRIKAIIDIICRKSNQQSQQKQK